MAVSFLCRFFAICALLFTSARAQEFETLQYGEGPERYSVFIPAKRPDTCETVLFLHGQGASNALVYGSWIRHLLESGRIVIFPKYQTGWLIPVVGKSQNRVEQALFGAIGHLRADRKLLLRKIHVIGHSLGGAIAANIVATTILPAGIEFSSLALIEPGTWLSKSGRLKNYSALSPGLSMMCITGSRDWVAAGRFARFVMDNSPQMHSAAKVHFEVTNLQHKKEFITSTHFDPAGPDMAFDTHNRNLVIRLAKAICPTDLTDERAFWLPVDCLMNENRELIDCGDLGTWSDGTSIGKLRTVQAEQQIQ